MPNSSLREPAVTAEEIQFHGRGTRGGPCENKCALCLGEWPCITVRLASENAELRAKLEMLDDAADGVMVREVYEEDIADLRAKLERAMALSRGFLDIDVMCTHCGQSLMAKRGTPGPIVIAGLYPFDLLHYDGARKCTRTYQAEPYSKWDLEPAFDAALRAEKGLKDVG